MEIDALFDFHQKIQDKHHIYFPHHCYLIDDEILFLELNLFVL